MIAQRAVIFLEDNAMHSLVAALYPQKPGLGIIYPAVQHTISAQFSMLMRKSLDPKIMKLLHTRCRWMHESGLTERKRLQLLPRSWYLTRPSSSQVYSLSTEDTAALFYMMLIGLSVGLAALAVMAVYTGIRRRDSPVTACFKLRSGALGGVFRIIYLTLLPLERTMEWAETPIPGKIPELQESDISAHPVIPTADRITVGTPLPAYVYANPRYYAGTPNEYVWLGLLVCWPLMSALISFIQAVRSPQRFKDTFTRNLFDILGIMMFEGE
ncbi:hypothetical protein MRX96_052336 [Rhipicephalus microplus]